MKKVILLFFITLIVITIMYKSGPEPSLRGFYQTETIDRYLVQLSFQPEDSSFVQYIDSREVDRGTYQLKKGNEYHLNGNMQNIELALNKDNSFDIVIEKINNGEPILLMNTSLIPAYSSTEFDDVEEYKDLLSEN